MLLLHTQVLVFSPIRQKQMCCLPSGYVSKKTENPLKCYFALTFSFITAFISVTIWATYGVESTAEFKVLLYCAPSSQQSCGYVNNTD